MEKAITRNPKTRVRSGREVSAILSAEEKKRLVKQKAYPLRKEMMKESWFPDILTKCCIASIAESLCSC